MTRSSAPFVAACVGAAIALGAGSSRADDAAATRRATAAREMDRPYTLAEASGGLFALPAANVCLRSTTDCEQGEGSLAVSLYNFYRYRSFAFGAGIEWATTLRGDAARGAPELFREHSRRYFLVQGSVRYYAWRLNDWEIWVGALAGGVVVSDAWSSLEDREPYADTDFVGPRSVTLGTEGFAIGAGIGADWMFYPNWSAGLQLRYANWVFPSAPKLLPTGDPASLSGRVDVISLSITLAYHIAL